MNKKQNGKCKYKWECECGCKCEMLMNDIYVGWSVGRSVNIPILKMARPNVELAQMNFQIVELHVKHILDNCICTHRIRLRIHMDILIHWNCCPLLLEFEHLKPMFVVPTPHTLPSPSPSPPSHPFIVQMWALLIAHTVACLIFISMHRLFHMLAWNNQRLMLARVLAIFTGVNARGVCCVLSFSLPFIRINTIS